MKILRSALLGLAFLPGVSAPAYAQEVPDIFIAETFKCHGVFQQIKDEAAGRGLKPEIEDGLYSFKIFHDLFVNNRK